MNELFTAVKYSYEQASWVTALALGLLMYRIFQSINSAYKKHSTFKEMKESEDRMAIIQFYIAVALSMICVFIFFLPYLLNYGG